MTENCEKILSHMDGSYFQATLKTKVTHCMARKQHV